MSDSITVIIILAVAIIAVAIVVGMGFSKINLGKQLDATSTESLADTLGKFDDPTKQAYDNMTVLGSEVIDVIKEYANSGECSIKVVTKADKTGKTDDEAIDDKACGKIYGDSTPVTWVPATGNDVTATPAAYTGASNINETGMFKGHIRRDSNDAIVLIAFVQQ